MSGLDFRVREGNGYGPAAIASGNCLEVIGAHVVDVLPDIRLGKLLVEKGISFDRDACVVVSSAFHGNPTASAEDGAGAKPHGLLVRLD